MGVQCKKGHSAPDRAHRIISVDIDHVNRPVLSRASIEIPLGAEEIADLVLHAVTERTCRCDVQAQPDDG